MRSPHISSLIFLLAACGGSSPSGGLVDAATDASLDATTDASDADVDASDADVEDPDAGCIPTVLLTGGTEVSVQGWTLRSQSPSELTYDASDTILSTSTLNGGGTSGQLLLVHEDAVPTDAPFAFEVVARVEAVNPHNQLDAAAAVLASFTSPAGVPMDRSAMVYLDDAAIGWADDTQSFAVNVLDGEFHSYIVAFDGAGQLTVSIDGVAALSRNGFTPNGTIAIGDQTNDPNVDATMRIRSVTLLCQ